MAEATNDVIYLEVDEDITSAIDKLTKSASKRVQVVTAKRSTLFQSVINLKLLHKAAKDAHKDLVLVTGDRVATSLAGRVGVAVAAQVGEAASVPSATPLAAAALADDEIDGGAIGDTKPDEPTTDIPMTEKTESTPLSSPTLAPPIAPETEPAAKAKSGDSKLKKPKVPNIGSMQKKLVWGGLILIVIVGFFVLTYLLSSANVTLYAQGSQVNASFSFTADPTAQQSNVANGVLSAQQLSESKTLNATVTATGTRDDGSKASGSITVTNHCYNPGSLAAGTTFIAPNGLQFVSTQAVTIPDAPTHFGSCSPDNVTVPVSASQNGDNYNLGSGTSYSINGTPSAGATYMSATGGQMQGGVSKVDKVITQSDVNQAQAAALAANKTNATNDLGGKASQQQTALGASFQQNVTSSSPNPAVGGVASSGSLAIQVTYTELAVQKSELSQVARSNEEVQLGSDKQIYDDGSGNLKLTASNPAASGAQKFQAVATASAGNKIDTTALANQLKGQKLGDARTVAGQASGVTNATVTLTPSWATSLPHMASHIHIRVKVASSSG